MNPLVWSHRIYSERVLSSKVSFSAVTFRCPSDDLAFTTTHLQNLRTWRIAGLSSRSVQPKRRQNQPNNFRYFQQVDFIQGVYSDLQRGNTGSQETKGLTPPSRNIFILKRRFVMLTFYENGIQGWISWELTEMPGFKIKILSIVLSLPAKMRSWLHRWL